MFSAGEKAAGLVCEWNGIVGKFGSAGGDPGGELTVKGAQSIVAKTVFQQMACVVLP